MSFYTDIIRRDPRFTSSAECRDPGLLDPHFRAVVEAIVAGAAAKGLTLEIGETFRSAERQKYLFAKGVTQLCHVGVHAYGLACDLLLITGGKYDPLGTHYGFLAGLCAAHPCPWGPTIWGGDWGEPQKPHSFRDYDHVQAIAVARQDALFDGAWYPAPPA